MAITDEGRAYDASQSATSQTVEQAVRSIRELLGMEIAWIAELDEDRKVFRFVDGDGPSFGFSEGDEMPADASYCQRLVHGTLDPIVRDARDDERVRDLPLTTSAGVGSYIGVPIMLGDGTAYGTLCCASHRPNHGLGERDVEFLRALSRRVAAQLEELEFRAGKAPAS